MNIWPSIVKSLNLFAETPILDYLQMFSSGYSGNTNKDDKSRSALLLELEEISKTYTLLLHLLQELSIFVNVKMSNESKSNCDNGGFNNTTTFTYPE